MTGRKAVTLVRQTEASECGLACVAMIANYHGAKTGLTELRRRFGGSLRGTSLKYLIQIAESLGLSANPVKLELDELTNLALPAIIHWDLNHFVVLTDVRAGPRGTRYLINDPASGSAWFRASVLSNHFTGIAVELTKGAPLAAEPAQPRFKLRQLWSSISGFWRILGQVAILSIVIQLIALAGPAYLEIAVDTAYPSFDRDLLLMLALGFGGLYVIEFAVTWLRAVTLVSLSSSLSLQLTSNLFRHLLNLPLSWFERRHTGDIVSRFQSTQPVSQTLSQSLIASLIDGILALATLVMMFFYSVLLALLATSAVVIYALLRLAFLQSMRFKNVDSISTAAKEQSTLIETIRGIGAIKSGGAEPSRFRIWRAAKADAVNSVIRLGRLNAFFDSAEKLVASIERVLFIYIAVSLALDHTLTLGMIFALQAYKQQFVDASLRLVDQAMNYRIMRIHLTRISDIALSRPDFDGASDDTAPARPCAIEVKDLLFRYSAADPEVLRGVNLQIAAGEFVAIMGPSGGGKTTLMKVMAGLFRPNHGSVSLDGRSLHSYRHAALRSAVGYVSQEDVLFAGSLAENIAFFDPDLDMDRVVEVAKTAAIHEEISAMPMRYESLVGDMGSALSGGQRQRILLARALYPRPGILFLDEFTAHLDPSSEALVVEQVRALGTTCVVSSHRPRPISVASRVFVIEEGRLREFKPAEVN